MLGYQAPGALAGCLLHRRGPLCAPGVVGVAHEDVGAPVRFEMVSGVALDQEIPLGCAPFDQLQFLVQVVEPELELYLLDNLWE